jgi:hypothetical protein
MTPARQYVDVRPDLRSDQQERQRRSVQHLQGLYTVVVALALALAAERLFPSSAEGLSPLRRFVLASALLATLIPFYHGTLRHLDDVYGHGLGHAAHSFSVLVDFLLLFLESCVFLTLAVSINEAGVFAWLFFTLLALDVAWAYLTTTYLVVQGERPGPKTWLRVNFSFGLVFLAILLLFRVGWPPSDALPYVVLFVALTRTATDYAFSWKFYVAAHD